MDVLFLQNLKTSIMPSGHQMAIRLALHGCVNRPFYHVVVLRKHQGRNRRPIEQLGSYDPMPNEHKEKLVAINFDRLTHHLTKGAELSEPVAKLLGLFNVAHPVNILTLVVDFGFGQVDFRLTFPDGQVEILD